MQEQGYMLLYLVSKDKTERLSEIIYKIKDVKYNTIIAILKIKLKIKINF